MQYSTSGQVTALSRPQHGFEPRILYKFSFGSINDYYTLIVDMSESNFIPLLNMIRAISRVKGYERLERIIPRCSRVGYNIALSLRRSRVRVPSSRQTLMWRNGWRKMIIPSRLQVRVLSSVQNGLWSGDRHWLISDVRLDRHKYKLLRRYGFNPDTKYK